MCVIIAKKCRLTSTKKENWFLYKIRDRNYDPVYDVDVVEDGNLETLYLVDKGTAWAEGVNSNGIMIVSAALNNTADLEDNGSPDDEHGRFKVSEQTKILRQAMKQKTLKDACNVIIDGLFVGSTFVSDGDKAIAIEIYIKQEFFDNFVKEYGTEKFEKLSHNDQSLLVAKHAKKESYNIASEEIKGNFEARTNHGKLIPSAGFQPTDDDLNGYKSSTSRLNTVKDALRIVGLNSHPFEVLTIIKNLKNVYTKRSLNPIRTKKGKKDETSYYSSTIVMLTPTGTIFVVPLESTIEDKRKLTLRNDRKVDLVILPRNLPLFESFRGLLTMSKYNL